MQLATENYSEHGKAVEGINGGLRSENDLLLIERDENEQSEVKYYEVKYYEEAGQVIVEERKRGEIEFFYSPSNSDHRLLVVIGEVTNNTDTV
jgi:hypothetical protein